MGAPFPHPYRTTPDMLDDIRRDLDVLLSDCPATVRSVDEVGTSDAVLSYPNDIGVVPAEPDTAAEARNRHMRRALHQALDFGFVLLDAIDLGPAALDLMDSAIAALDALDGDTDLEHEVAEDDGTLEPTLGAPEEHPFVPSFSHYYRCRDGRQLMWAQGSRLDGEGEAEAGYDLPEGDRELDDDGLSGGEGDGADDEPWLASPAGDGDQEHWAQGDSRDHEDVNENGGGEYDPGWYERPIGPVRPEAPFHDHRQAMRAVARQAVAVKERIQGPAPRRDPDLVTFVGIPPGMALWGGPVARHPHANIVLVEMSERRP